MNSREVITFIKEGGLDESFQTLYGSAEGQRERYIACIEEHIQQFGEKESLSLFSAPGRAELGGSHTDSQHGWVLTGAVTTDIIGVAGENAHNMMRVSSAGYRSESIDLWDLRMKDRERARPAALIRGIAAQFQKREYALRGFDLCAVTNVKSGSGLSSSASFELLIASAINSLYCGGELSPIELAMVAHKAENEYFGKPNGLTNQTVCAVGDCVVLDLNCPEKPVGERIDFDLQSHGYFLTMVDTGYNHTFLDDDLASIPFDMRCVAQCFGRQVLREVSPQEFYADISRLRKRTGDKAVLRAAYYYDENERVRQMASAIKANDLTTFFRLVNACGIASHELLQNVYSERNPREQGLSVALCLARRLLSNGDGACRIQAPGFSGAMQAYVKKERLAEFICRMEEVFGAGCCLVLSIRKAGATQLL